jgi:hypothetical protein
MVDTLNWPNERDGITTEDFDDNEFFDRAGALSNYIHPSISRTLLRPTSLDHHTSLPVPLVYNAYVQHQHRTTTSRFCPKCPPTPRPTQCTTLTNSHGLANAARSLTCTSRNPQPRFDAKIGRPSRRLPHASAIMCNICSTSICLSDVYSWQPFIALCRYTGSSSTS